MWVTGEYRKDIPHSCEYCGQVEYDYMGAEMDIRIPDSGHWWDPCPDANCPSHGELAPPQQARYRKGGIEMRPAKRLRVLYNYLMSGAIDETQFDMEEWPHCAIGEAAEIPTLSRDGLQIDCFDEPEYMGLKAYDAVAKFFGIPLVKAETIFGPRQRKPATVAKEIKPLLKA